MRKLNINLPRYRLHIEYRFIKRRRPLVEEPIFLSIKRVKKKYRKGTLVARYFRHVFEHKNIKKALGINLALIVFATSIIPPRVALDGEPDETVITSQNILTTSPSIQYPLSSVKITQMFSLFHPGIDLDGVTGDSIKPIKSGKVIAEQYSKYGYGTAIIIDHGNLLTSLYAHLSKTEVKIGDQVNMDTEIGKMGATGHVSGDHLHLEVRDHGIPINPLSVLP